MKDLWTKLPDKILLPHLEAQVKATLYQKGAIESSRNPAHAQLWVAIANLSQQIIELNRRIKYIEQVLKDSLKYEKKEKE